VSGASFSIRSIRNNIVFGRESKPAVTYRTVDPAFLFTNETHHVLFGILDFRHTILLLLPGLRSILITKARGRQKTRLG
jgi:hypothetical protein